MTAPKLWLMAFTVPFVFALAIGEDDKDVYPTDSTVVEKKQINIKDPSEFLIVKTASVRNHKDGIDLYFRIHANSYSQKFSLRLANGEFQDVRHISYRESVRTGVGRREIIVNPEWTKKATPKEKPIFHWYEGDIPAVNYFKATFPKDSENLSLTLRLKLDDGMTTETAFDIKLK